MLGSARALRSMSCWIRGFTTSPSSSDLEAPLREAARPHLHPVPRDLVVRLEQPRHAELPVLVPRGLVEGEQVHTVDGRQGGQQGPRTIDAGVTGDTRNERNPDP